MGFLIRHLGLRFSPDPFLWAPSFNKTWFGFWNSSCRKEKKNSVSER